jgi:hypothetical protein
VALHFVRDDGLRAGNPPTSDESAGGTWTAISPPSMNPLDRRR